MLTNDYGTLIARYAFVSLLERSLTIFLHKTAVLIRFCRLKSARLASDLSAHHVVCSCVTLVRPVTGTHPARVSPRHTHVTLCGTVPSAHNKWNAPSSWHRPNSSTRVRGGEWLSSTRGENFYPNPALFFLYYMFWVYYQVQPPSVLSQQQLQYWHGTKLQLGWLIVSTSYGWDDVL